jgi:hypothetical protein
MSRPNYHLTVRPRILYQVRESERAGDGARTLILQIYGHEPATRAREFNRAYMTPGTPEYRIREAATSDQDRRILAALLLLARANQLPAGSAAAKDLYDATRLLIPDYPAPQSVFCEAKSLTDPKKVAWLYPALLNDKISKSRLLMTRRRGEPFLPSILCPDIPTAAFVFASYRGIEVCPGCRKLFAPNPDRSQTYCSENCGQRIYQRRYRRRQKSGRRVN